MKTKTSELSGAALDWAVAKCEGFIMDCNSWLYEATLEEVATGSFKPSTGWAQGGPIIERENISLAGKDPLHDCWAAMTQYGTHKHEGPTPLIAAMRCYVASKLGDTIEVPEELI